MKTLTHKLKLKLNILPQALQSAIVGLSSLVFIACSGGGGSATQTSSNSGPTESYPPTSERLLEEASTSKDLYIEQDFLFDHTQRTQLSVQLFNSEGGDLTHTRLNVYLVDTVGVEAIPSEWSDEWLDKAHLISGGLSNESGEFIRIIEFPVTHQRQPLLLIEVNAIGFENKVLIAVNDERTHVTLGTI